MERTGTWRRPFITTLGGCATAVAMILRNCHWACITVATLLLSGCMSAVQHTQRGVLEARLNIGGSERLIRAPATCRSFVHPTGGMRVTRQDLDVFEVPSDTAERLFLHMPYTCSLTDAAILISGNSYVSAYTLSEKPELRITERRAIPVNDPNAQDAEVVLLSRRVDQHSHEVNVAITTDFHRGLLAAPGQTYLQSISTIELATAFEKLPEELKQRLAGAREPLFLDDESNKLFTLLINPLRLSIDDYPNDLRFWQSQVVSEYSAETKQFSVDPSYSQRGKRVYYFVAPMRDCRAAEQPCRTYEYSYRFGQLQRDNPRTTYDPTRRAFYVPVHKVVSYQAQKPNAPTPAAEEDARITHASWHRDWPR